MAINKVINSQSQEFQPVLTDTLVLDAVPTVNSFNSVTSDAVARAVAGASGEVPQVTEADNGKVLTAVYDEGGPAVEWADAQGGIPNMTNQDGKILGAVDNGGTMEAQWIDKPEVTAEYTMVYNTTPAGGSLDGTPWQAVRAGKRIGVVVPYSAFSGSLAAGSLYSTGKIYMPLASVVDRGSGECKWNFYLYDGANKWSLALTCEEDEWSWGTPRVVPG